MYDPLNINELESSDTPMFPAPGPFDTPPVRTQTLNARLENHDEEPSRLQKLFDYMQAGNTKEAFSLIRELSLSQLLEFPQINLNGATLLHMAAQLNQIQIAHLLILKGISPLQGDKYRSLPLHYAVTSGCEEIAHILPGSNHPQFEVTAHNFRELSQMIRDNLAVLKNTKHIPDPANLRKSVEEATHGLIENMAIAHNRLIEYSGLSLQNNNATQIKLSLMSDLARASSTLNDGSRQFNAPNNQIVTHNPKP